MYERASGEDLTASMVIDEFSSEWPEANSLGVFSDNSDYDTNRKVSSENSNFVIILVKY